MSFTQSVWMVHVLHSARDAAFTKRGHHDTWAVQQFASLTASKSPWLPAATPNQIGPPQPPCDQSNDTSFYFLMSRSCDKGSVSMMRAEVKHSPRRFVAGLGVSRMAVLSICSAGLPPAVVFPARVAFHERMRAVRGPHTSCGLYLPR
jgi:hypothetical protein